MRRRTHSPLRFRAPVVLAALALLTGVTGCNDVRSIEPAIDTVSALELPALEGRWIMPDTAVLEVRRSADGSRAYDFGFQDLAPEAEQTPAAARDAGESPPVWLSGRVGRLGGHLVLELSPGWQADSTLHRVMDAYQPFILGSYVVVGLQVNSTELRIAYMNADSIDTVAPALLRSGACATPYLFVGRRRLLLTGSSAEVRTAYECLLDRRGFADTSVFLRSTP